MGYLLFGIEIKQKNQFLETLNMENNLVYFSDLKEIELFIALGYVEGCGFSKNSEILFKKCWTHLITKTVKPPEIIFFSIYKILYEYIYENLIMLYIHNYEVGTLESNQPYAREEANNELKLLRYFLKEAISTQILIESSPSNDDLMNDALKNTFEMINNFNQFEHLEEYEHICAHCDYIINNTNMNSFKKSIKSSKMDYLSCEDNKLFLIHIVNLVYSYLYLLSIVKSEEKYILDKYTIKYLDSSDYQFEIANLIKNLSEFKNKVHTNQILQYVSKYYHQNYIFDEIEFDVFKKFISKLFNKQISNLFASELNIDNIIPPFDFLYYNTLLLNDKNNKYAVRVRQLCTSKRG